MRITVGIDLGTTNSVISVKKIGVSILRNSEKEELTPSCVTAIPNPDNTSFEIVVGRHSRNILKQYPEKTITSVKRLMGRDFNDLEVQNILKEHRVTYQITTDPSEPESIRIPLGNKMQTPEMISGMILSKLIRDGEIELEGNIGQAVVTVPAYFSDRQKFATRAACDYAGIKLLRLLPEPTAAALSFGLGELDKNESKTIMVFDLGGGTFDISILSFAGGSFMEITKGGDMWLGGDDIDQLIINHVFQRAQKETGCKSIIEMLEQLSPADKARFLVEIKEKAEAAKIALSSVEEANIDMFGLLKDENNTFIDIDVTITRPEFSELLKPIVQRVSQIAHQILYEIRFEPALIDTVLMVGGSSLVPAIQDELKNIFGSEKVMIHPRPMFAIAEGAALMAAKMASQDTITNENAFAMMHSTAHDYYLQLAGGKKHLLVARNTPLPFKVEEKLTFSHVDQFLARLRVFNEVEGVLDTVGELWFHREENQPGLKDDLKPTEIMLRFTVDEDNIITMKAWSLQNENQSIEAEIARGGLATKLYNDLENTISSIISNAHNAGIERDVFLLSQIVVKTILSASDPVTGETRLDIKQKAERQINTLKTLQNQESPPLSVLEFASTVREAAAQILSDKEKTRMDVMIGGLKHALENLDDPEKLKNLLNENVKCGGDLSTAYSLGKAEHIAKIIQTNIPDLAKSIRNQASTLVTVYLQKNKALIQNAEDMLHDLIHSRLSWSNTARRRFDRDVNL